MLAFLQTLLPVAAAANAVARQALSQMRQAADEVQQRWDAQQREMEQQEAGGVSASSTQEEIARYFQRRRQQKEQQQEAGGHPLEAMERGGAAPPAAAKWRGAHAPAEGSSTHTAVAAPAAWPTNPIPSSPLLLSHLAEEEEHKVPMSGSEREHVSLLRRHAHAAGSLAQAVADAISPLALSKPLQVAVQSFGVCIEALRTLAATTEAVELDTNKARLLLLPGVGAVVSLHGWPVAFFKGPLPLCLLLEFSHQGQQLARASPPC